MNVRTKETRIPIRVGITGQNGFIGTNLVNFFRVQNDIKVIEFNKQIFSSPKMLEDFVSQCDVIIQLAAISRHQNLKLLYDNNIKLDKKLINALENSHSKAHVLFASTTHELRDGEYYASKREGQNLFKEWAKQNDAKFTTMVIPNTFGPYGKPFFNSVVSTFCYKVANNETPEIIIDAPIDLIYIHELCQEFYKVIKQDITTSYTPNATTTIKVSEILNLLLTFHKSYVKQSIIPNFKNSFELQLFETYQSYLKII